MSLPDQLAQARADLVSLDGDTPKLEANVTQQSSELDRLRREARAGRATFDQVVKQQTRRDAAAGMLHQHLQDVAQARALVDELTAAQAEADTRAQLAQVRETLTRLEAEYHAEAGQLETYLAERADHLRGLAQQHAKAQASLWRVFLDGAAVRAGVSVQVVSDVVRDARAAPTGPIRQQVREALGAVATDHEVPDLLPLAQEAMRGQPYRSTPTPAGLPLVSRVLEARQS